MRYTLGRTAVGKLNMGQLQKAAKTQDDTQLTKTVMASISKQFPSLAGMNKDKQWTGQAKKMLDIAKMGATGQILRHATIGATEEAMRGSEDYKAIMFEQLKYLANKREGATVIAEQLKVSIGTAVMIKKALQDGDLSSFGKTLDKGKKTAKDKGPLTNKTFKDVLEGIVGASASKSGGILGLLKTILIDRISGVLLKIYAGVKTIIQFVAPKDDVERADVLLASTIKKQNALFYGKEGQTALATAGQQGGNTDALIGVIKKLKGIGHEGKGEISGLFDKGYTKKWINTLGQSDETVNAGVQRKLRGQLGTINDNTYSHIGGKRRVQLLGAIADKKAQEMAGEGKVTPAMMKQAFKETYNMKQFGINSKGGVSGLSPELVAAMQKYNISSADITNTRVATENSKLILGGLLKLGSSEAQKDKKYRADLVRILSTLDDHKQLFIDKRVSPVTGGKYKLPPTSTLTISSHALRAMKRQMIPTTGPRAGNLLTKKYMDLNMDTEDLSPGLKNILYQASDTGELGGKFKKDLRKRQYGLQQILTDPRIAKRLKINPEQIAELWKFFEMEGNSGITLGGGGPGGGAGGGAGPATTVTKKITNSSDNHSTMETTSIWKEIAALDNQVNAGVGSVGGSL